ncbi:MAG: hypothetical protein O2816_15830 [Planctomycetota bacterium]|nr:hypothetical protein [Planctomycetota bacterium]
MPTLQRTLAFATASILLSTTAQALQGDCIVEWRADSGLFPDQAAPAWTLVDSATADPVLAGGELELCTTEFGHSMYYRQDAADLALPALWVIEFTMQYVSGDSDTNNACGPAREPAVVAFELANANVGRLHIGQDRLMINSACCTSGATVNLPTADAFHDYRLEIDTSGGGFEVYRDGVQVLTGSVLLGCTSAGTHLFWGEASSLTLGCHRWRSFSHNGGACIGSRYCSPANTNSTGAAAELVAFGQLAVASNDVTLLATSLPANQFGYFLTSTTQAFVPFPGSSQGNLCLGGAIGRYSSSVMSSGSLGRMALVLDLTQTPTPGGSTSVVAGETWNYQLWFRDLNPTPTSNFTDARSITFE